jgi:hypothetical protein
MIDISADVKIQVTLCKGAVYYFVEPTFADTDQPHYFVVLNEKPLNDTTIVLACATSQIQKRRKFVESRNLPETTLVEIVPGAYKHFSLPTIFNCNDPLEKTKESLVLLLNDNKLNPFLDPIDSKIVADICRGVHDSPLVENRIKKLLGELS